MKKLLLSVAAALFVFGCASSDTAPVAIDDNLAALQSSLAQYNNTCADIAFRDSRAKVQEAQRYRASGDIAKAELSYQQAKQSYDAGLASYNNSMNAVDRANSEMADHVSRLQAVRTDAMKYAPKEFNDGNARVTALHNDAAAKLRNCDIAGARAAIDEAEKEVRYIEDITYVRMNADKGTAEPVKTGNEVYTVKKGDCLWKIAANKYSNPYFWPLIYWSNKSQIKDPDLIYPNQKLTIEYNQSATEKADAEKLSKTRGPWSLYDGK